MSSEILEFVTFMIGCVAMRLKQPCATVYRMMKEKNIINYYLIGCYDVLYTFNRDYATDEVIDYMRYKGITV